MNPATGHACIVLTNADTGAPVARNGGDSRLYITADTDAQAGQPRQALG